MLNYHQTSDLRSRAQHLPVHQVSYGLTIGFYVFYNLAIWWRHHDVTSFWLQRVVESQCADRFKRKKWKKNSLNLPNTLKNMEKCKNFMTSLIFMRWCHSHMTANFGYTSSQLRYKPKLRSIDHVLLLLLPFEKSPL